MVFLPNAPILLPLFDYKVARTINAVKREDKELSVKLTASFKDIRDKISNAESLTENDRLMINMLN